MEHILLNPKSAYSLLITVALCFLVFAKPALPANKDEATPPAQQEPTSPPPGENPFSNKPKKDTWTERESETKTSDDPSITEDTDSDISLRRQVLMPYLETLRRWKYPPDLGDLSELYDWKSRRKTDTKGIDLPMDSNLQITGYQSVTIEVNKTHYFGEGDLNRYGGYGYGSYGEYGSGLDLGLSSSYGYEDFGYSSGFGGGYDSFESGYGSGYSSYGRSGIPRATSINIRQQQKIGLHGRVGERTHIAVDYNAGDTYGGGYGGSSSYGGYGLGGAKEQKIKIWYEGKPESFIKTISFGDIMLSLPNTRFLNINRNLFGLEGVFEYKNTRVTAFGSRSKGVREVRTFRGQSRRSSYGYGPRGNQIADANYVKNRYYLIHQGEDGLLHDAYLPIKQGSVEIYIDDSVVGNNQGGKRTSQGYFNPQFPGQDYNIDYQTGEIEFLSAIASSYTIVVAYEYLGNGGGSVGKPGNVFADENGDSSIDEKGEEVGYVVLKTKGFRGTVSDNVYFLGNRNINPRDFQLTIIRQGESETFQTDTGLVPYIEIFGLDQNADGIVDPEFIDYDRGLLRFPNLHPFQINDPNHPYYRYQESLNNEAIYLESIRRSDQIYTIVADYSYQSETYNVGLFVIPDSETVRLNGKLLTRDTDYMMIYEVGTIRFFKKLDEFDEIVVEFEKTPFGGGSQQAVAGIWVEYTHKPKPKSVKEQNLEDRFNRLGGMPTTQIGLDNNNLGKDPFSENFPLTGSRANRGLGRTGFGGSDFSGGYSSFGSFGGRSRIGPSYLGGYGTGMNYFNPIFQKGFTISTGYILTTGQKPAEIPDVNSVPNRLQAFNINTSFGRSFNIAWLLNPLPLVNVQNFPLSIDFSGESAYSHNNPNSIGVALIDSMEGVKETTTIPTIKYNWKPSSVPYIPESEQTDSPTHNYTVLPTQENRALFKVALKDREESEAVGNYMRNRDVPASSIQPLSLSTEERLIMEIGYDFTDVVEEWGGFSNGISKSGVDYSERGFIEMWMRVQGDDDVTLYLNVGAVNEDTDADGRLDSEDLPQTLEDTNGDNIVDALDLDLENLPDALRYRGNGELDTGEDVGWRYDGAFQPESLGADNQILDSEDLNGDGVLDSVDAYFQIAVPLNEIPNEWVKSKNSNGWTFLSIPLSEFLPEGSRVPSLVFVQHFRLWLMKNRPGNVKGTFQWASIEIVGNRWEQGLVTQSFTETTTGLSDQKVVEDTIEKFIVGTKDNFSYDDYQSAYLEIEDDELFRKLHPFTATSLGFQTQQQREQTLSLEYYLYPGSHGITSKQLRGFTQSEGQDFSKHDTLRFWLYGDRSYTTFVLQLAPSVRTGYRSSFYSSDSFLNQPQQEEDVNIFENLTDYYEYTVLINFEGWKLIEIDLRDHSLNEYPDRIEDQTEDIDTPNQQSQPSPTQNAPDGHPDGFTVRGTETGVSRTQLSIKNIGGILLGIRNDTEREISGEVWVNEIHLGDPLIRSGWARRGNMSVSLGSIIELRGGYASQDKDFESGAGEIGRQRLSSRGYSTTNNDYNIDADVTLFSWLPIRYSIKEQESETEALRGSYSSFQSGKSETHNRDVSVQFRRNPLPNLGFAYNYQDFWNERQGTQISHLYTGTFRYNIGSKLGFNVQYRHEDILAKPETATDTTGSSASYYSYGYGRNRDEKTDSGSITLNISPINVFSLSPSYDVRRTLERRDQNRYRSSFTVGGVSTPDSSVEEDASEDTLSDFSIAAREHRLSLTPRLNRDLLGLRPTVTSRMSFRENWFTSQKDASLNGNISLGLNLRIQKWFGWLLPKEKPETEEIKESEDATIQKLGKKPLAEQQLEQLRENGIDETQIQKLAEEQTDWINRDKVEMDTAQKNTPATAQEGLFHRIINSFTINTNANFTATESFRQLVSGQSLIEIWRLDPEANERTNSRKSNRYTVRTSVSPWKSLSFGTNLSTADSFRKSYGSTFTSHAETYEADVKINPQQASSFQLRYSFTIRQSANLEVTLSDSAAHTPSLSWIHKWSEETRTSLGIRTTLRDHLRSGIESNALIITPNFSIDYRYRTEGGIRVPFFGRIPLKHDLDLTNTFSLAIRRENYGANKEERSERYETTLRAGYKLSDHLTANLHLGLSYNHDRVEEGRDFLSIASALTVRGEFQ